MFRFFIRQPARCCLPVLAVLAAGLLTSCAGKGLLVEEYPRDVYEGVVLYEPGAYAGNPHFLAYGDTQAGWRVREMFLRRERWVTKKAFIFPFYYLYNVGQGLVGTVNWMRSVPDYGGKERRMVRDAVFAAVGEEQPDFLLHLGDMCLNDGRKPRHWATWLEESKLDVPLLVSVPVVPVIGNHERANDPVYGYPNYETVFPEAKRFYVLDYPDAAVFVIDSNFILDQNQHIDPEEQERLWREWIIAPEGEEPAWLQRELARRNQRFKIVAMHHPPISFGFHHDDWIQADYGERLAGKRNRLLDLFLDNGVQLVLSGHEHVYQHSVVRHAGDERSDAPALHVVITSGGGAPVRPLADPDGIERMLEYYRRQGMDVRPVRQERVYHYSVVDVSENRLQVDTYRVEASGTTPLLESIEIEPQ